MRDNNKYLISILYSISFILIGYYFFVMFNSINPKVCKEYKMHYITRELLDWPGYNGLEYELGSKIEFKNDSNNITKCRGIGWHDIEEFGTWTQDKSYIYLNLHEELNEELEFNIGIDDFVPDAELFVRINDQNVGEIKPQKDIKQYKVIIPDNIVEQCFLKIEFNIKNAISPSTFVENGDARLLGVYVTSVEINKRKENSNDK